ncbi:hypothetical protein AALC17_14975 [Oscillospiraceae bacterium 38-13]
MIREIGGRWWYCCPRCGKKLHPLRAGAVCRGVLARCRERYCGWSGEIIVEPGAPGDKRSSP